MVNRRLVLWIGDKVVCYKTMNRYFDFTISTIS